MPFERATLDNSNNNNDILFYLSGVTSIKSTKAYALKLSKYDLGLHVEFT